MNSNYIQKNQHTKSYKNDKNCIVSYGVACTRKNKDTGCYEVLMIKKRHTYAFIEFVRGMYDPYKDADLEFMFDRMTILEKSLIQTKPFEILWQYCCNDPQRSSERSIYNKSQKKFQALLDRGVTLKQLISKTKNTSLLWEIPKGRADKNETQLMSAVREFEEETGLNKNDYKLLFDEGTIEYSFIDCGHRYKYIYYIAILNQNTILTYDYNNIHMLREVSDIQFMASSAVKELNNQRLTSLVRIIIKKIKKYFK